MNSEPTCTWCDGGDGDGCTCDFTQVMPNHDVKRILESPEYSRAIQVLSAPTPSLFRGRKP
jgi:hypothetical protein